MRERKGGDGSLRIPNFIDMRSMKKGEARVFALRSSTAVAMVQHRIGGSFTQSVSILVDPKTAVSQRVQVVTCLARAPKHVRKKRTTA